MTENNTNRIGERTHCSLQEDRVHYAILVLQERATIVSQRSRHEYLGRNVFYIGHFTDAVLWTRFARQHPPRQMWLTLTSAKVPASSDCTTHCLLLRFRLGSVDLFTMFALAGWALCAFVWLFEYFSSIC